MEIVLIVSGQAVNSNSKINWPDQNYEENSGRTILRTLHKVDYTNLTIQLDGTDGMILDIKDLPTGVGFYQKIEKKPTKSK